MKPLIIENPKRDRNWYGDFPAINITVHDHRYIPLPEALEKYLKGYRSLINHKSSQPMIHL
ncbi:hypothetical protein HMI55_005215, partial [Coelomomyces lativittatus]